ncbi:MAG TPA: YkgJ family cysteine cluster protein [Luteimonas sp.]|nr:YkgJ family cysteine cluster protein [Luteimonas sp.]
MPHPCLSCGACCAHFRVSFHWSEAEPALGGVVPVELTEPLRSHERVMRGTSQAQPRCIALDARIGEYSRCGIHPVRPSVCAAVPASWEFGEPSAQCDKARLAHGLPLLVPADWAWREAAANDGDDNPDDNGNEPPALPPPIAA